MLIIVRIKIFHAASDKEYSWTTDYAHQMHKCTNTQIYPNFHFNCKAGLNHRRIVIPKLCTRYSVPCH